MVDPPDSFFILLTLSFMTAASEPALRHNGLSYKELISVFNHCFFAACNCELVSGYREPIYFPAQNSTPARVCFREDFASSALHEAAHWCIAGEKRRQLVDFGYWYEPDGRTGMQQKEFEQVEVKPQALEWLFSLAAGICFQVSVDNLAGEQTDTSSFKQAVYTEAQSMINNSLPKRAQIFLDALRQQTGSSNELVNMLSYQDIS
jgi:elongation factor P hydroxylase